jgi:hypothetical protein
VACNIAKDNKPFSDCEFVKQCVVDVIETVCPENGTAFENTSLSRRTILHHMEEMTSNFQTQLNETIYVLCTSL